MNILTAPPVPVPSHKEIQEISKDIWREKYRYGEEKNPGETHSRVVWAVYKYDAPERAQAALDAMNRWEFCPGGRILASAGTEKRTTLLNCFVSRKIDDSLEGIMDALKEAAITQQQGGGIGMDFSSLRPRGAIVKRTHSVSSGVIPFMRMWNAMCGTIKSSGSRRGAMMATLRVDHPDILDFIECKNTAGELTNFNISVLVTDQFMEAVSGNETWDLTFPVPNVSTGSVIYHSLPARVLWDKILRHTYEFSEPGVLFIDRINGAHNLGYCEKIYTTNPCSELPLSPYDSCCLGALNLTQFVHNPFYLNTAINYRRLEEVTRIAVRFLDNVRDVTAYPLEEQRVQAGLTRRIGLGIMGLGNMLQMLGVRYGSNQSIATTSGVMKVIRDVAYDESCNLAHEREPFKNFSPKYLLSPFVEKLPGYVKEKIKAEGIRNGTILTIAPTGTTAIYVGNVSSGLEPTFSWEYKRKVLQNDNSFKSYVVEDYGYSLFRQDHDLSPLPDYMVTAGQIPIREHLLIQAACQEYVDASLSKTINCPKEISYDEFKAVYEEAYRRGLKGCTTYRPSEVRGAILEEIPNGSCKNGTCEV